MANTSLQPPSPPKKDETSGKQSIIRKLSLGRSSLAWPTWSTIGRSQGRPSTDFTIRIEPGILEYSKTNDSTAVEAFKEAANHIRNLRAITHRDEKSVDVTDKELVDQMTMVIFGSNMIERVGSSLEETIHLCRKIFLGEKLSDILPRSPEYHQRLEQYIRSNTQSEQKIRSRREVTNHAMAFMHMVDAIILEDQPFSEDLIKSTHSILCSGLSVIGGNFETIESDSYAGQYRALHICAGSTNFVTPNRIGQAMATFIKELNDYLSRAEKSGEIDPFFIAAEACGQFVNIHPFLDGNGRTCRLILNTILLKYAGIVCPIGEKDSDRKEYLDIAKRRSDEAAGNGELALYTLKQSVSTLRRLRDKILARK